MAHNKGIIVLIYAFKSIMHSDSLDSLSLFIHYFLKNKPITVTVQMVGLSNKEI